MLETAKIPNGIPRRTSDAINMQTGTLCCRVLFMNMSVDGLKTGQLNLLVMRSQGQLNVEIHNCGCYEKQWIRRCQVV